MASRSIHHRIQRTALALAVLLQSAFAAPVGACGMGGSCCSASSACQESGTCCCVGLDGQSGVAGHSCCHDGAVSESVADGSSCCHSTGSTSNRCTCSCSQPKPAPAAPPVDQETQTRLIPVYVYLTVAADLTPVLAVSTRRNECQSSLLKTAPRSVQVLFCTWQT